MTPLNPMSVATSLQCTNSSGLTHRSTGWWRRPPDGRGAFPRSWRAAASSWVEGLAAEVRLARKDAAGAVRTLEAAWKQFPASRSLAYAPADARIHAGQAREAVIRTPLKEIMAQLDPLQFVQAHRSVGVNLRAIAHITRSGSETADIHVKGRSDVLPVSRTYLHLFRQM